MTTPPPSIEKEEEQQEQQQKKKLEDEQEEAKLIEDLYNLRIAKVRAEFDFWSMLLDKVTNPTQFPGSMEKLQELGLRDVKEFVKVYRNKLADLLEEKEISARNGYKLSFSPEKEDDPWK